MTAQILSSELSNLIQESKRKQTDLRVAAEKSLEELKGLKSSSELQLATDLSQRPQFVTPFIIACGTKNAKFTGIAIVCLQRLVVSRALPRSRLKEVLEAFREATSQGLDVQLKILQSLPSLLQNYGGDIKGDLLAAALNICSVLQASKNGMVNNTSAATLQQLVVAVFDKVVIEDKTAIEIPKLAEVPIEGGTTQVRAAAFDAYRVFNDLCLLTESQKPQFLKVLGLPQTFGLELIESVLTNHADIFLTHAEQANILRIRVMPFIISSLSERQSFATTVRTVRILYTLLRRHLSILVAEGEMALGLLNHMLDPETPQWKRALIMEVFRGLFAEGGLIRHIFALYDAQTGRKPVLGDLVASFVRLSTEKPNVIGLSHQSTVPTGNPFTGGNTGTDQAMLEASGVGGIISPIASGESSSGISTQWSSMRVPCIDQLDKTEPPAIPESYIYSLTLTCINGFSEGLAKFILPLTVPTDGRSRKRGGRPSEPSRDVASSESTEKVPTTPQLDPSKSIDRGGSFKKNPVPLNPLTLEDHPLYEDIKMSAAIIDECWPAVLATCSTFLYAALDADYYHGLVRSFQKFTHVAGLLRLSTPRDAFLTTLGKAAVPPNVFTANSAPMPSPSVPSAEHQSLFSNARGLLSIDSLTSPTAEKPRQLSVEISTPSLNTRNLLCLRALLNLGIALGPTLDIAWLIIFETLQQADFVLFSSSRGAARSPSSTSQKVDNQIQSDNSALLLNFGTEIKAVETAASRLFESTIDFPNESFVDVVRALCKIFGREDVVQGDPPSSLRPGSSSSTRKASHTHRRMYSISTTSPAQNQEDFFALAKLADVASINIERLIAFDPDASGWTILASELISAATMTTLASPVRLRAAEVLVHIVLEAAAATMSIPDKFRTSVQHRLLHTFWQALEPLEVKERVATVTTSTTDIDVYRIILEGLKNVLEHCGETLISGWDVAFEIIGSAFVKETNTEGQNARSSYSRSPRLIRSSFSSLQLICSDFLSSLPSSCFLMLVDTLYNFCTQDDDLNICLTTVTFFWVLSDFISNRTDSFSLDSDLLLCEDEQTLIGKASSDDMATSSAALWMLLLLRLTVVTTDDRLELRNSAIQTLLRIFDAYGDQLSPEAWSVCIQSIIFKMLSSIEERLSAATTPETLNSDKEKVPWVETTVVVLAGVSGLLATYLRILAGHSSFAHCWRTLLDHYRSLLDFGILDINTAIFKALGDILSPENTTAGTETVLDRGATDLVWELWSQGLPLASKEVPVSNTNNQNCLIAYVSSLKELYRLLQEDIDFERTQRILVLLRKTVQEANVESYSADVEYLTTLQAQVLEALKMIRTDIEGVPAAMIRQVAEFVALAFQDQPEDSSQKQRPTYVALSKASMTLLESLVVSHSQDAELYTKAALSSSLTALSKPIEIKYAFSVSVKSLAPWRQATTTALNILKATIPSVTRQKIPENDLRSIWMSIVKIANGITAADCSAVSGPQCIKEDQDFDIASFLSLRDLIVPALGEHVGPEKCRRAYTESLFHTSLIHTPETSELPQSHQELLASLYRVRKGRTVDPSPSPRTKMSYVCLDELFSLVSIHNSSPARIKLAQAAAPYLIVRAGLTLRAYIADQPLRGLMPQPLSQRKELLYILKALVGLECEPEAIPDTPGVDSEGKKHLHRLYPLVAKAVRAAARDQEVLEWLGRALDEVGTDFNV